MVFADAADVPRRTLVALVLAAVALFAGIALASAHPLAPLTASTAFIVAALAAWRYPCAWPWVVPALLPVVALAPWSGALAFEELDLVVLAMVVGGYAARHPPAIPGARRAASTLGALLIVAFGTSWALGLWRGLDDAGSLPGGWLDGYHDPGNAVRVAKSALWAALLLPLWHACLRRSADRAAASLATGIACGLAMTGLVVVNERVAFTGLTNFSTDYRVTGPFWEMHAGGAALDGYLALALPWVVWLALRARGAWQWLISSVAAGLAYYIALVTFSRAVYLALPLGLAVLVLVQARQEARAKGALLRDTLGLFAAGIIAAVGTWLFFRHGGYRTLGAVLGVVGASLALAPALRSGSRRATLAAALAGALLALPAALAALAVWKGPYILYAIASAVCVVVMLRTRSEAAVPRGASAALAFLAAAALLVAWHWGGAPALRDTVWVIAALLALIVAHATAARPVVPASLRLRALLLAVIVGVAGVVAVMAGGDYMSGRLAGARDDLDARVRHWSDTLALLDSPAAWALGHGHGRFPVRYFFAVPDGPHPGSYAVVGNAGRAWLVLAGPRHSASFGEMLRVGQWLPVVPGPMHVSLAVRVEKAALLHVELCDRHLLYNGECAIAKHEAKPGGATWQRVQLDLDASRIPARRWSLPNQAFFALAVESERGRVEIAEVTVAGADGVDRIANGTFEAGMARWFTISERHHLPWHAKNLALNVLFEQGLVGLLLFLALVLGALWRVSWGRARRHPLAPALAASLVGFLVVGLFDSLLDVPRVALLFWLLAFVAVTLPAVPPQPRGGAASPPA